MIIMQNIILSLTVIVNYQSFKYSSWFAVFTVGGGYRLQYISLIVTEIFILLMNRQEMKQLILKGPSLCS